MINFKPKFYYYSVLCFLFTFHLAISQDLITTQVDGEEISDNLDLEAVASNFGQSKNLEDFEKNLNHPDTQISNLDLNSDAEVDYLRVMETVDGDTHVISIQSVIAKDQYQEVATILVRKDSIGKCQVQIIGDVGMYGTNYYITPIYSEDPIFFTVFWIATYKSWDSPWHWGYLPPYFNSSRPYLAHQYRTNVNVHINVHNSYQRTNVSIHSKYLGINSKNNAFFKNNPDKSFANRNPGVSNRSSIGKTLKLPSTKKNNRLSGAEVHANNTSNVSKTNNIKNKPVTNNNSNSSRKPPQKPSITSSNHIDKNPNSNKLSNISSRQAPSKSSVARTRH